MKGRIFHSLIEFRKRKASRNITTSLNIQASIIEKLKILHTLHHFEEL